MRSGSQYKHHSTAVDTAVEAHLRGFTPVPVRHGSKRPLGSSWTHTRWESEDEVREAFTRFAEEGAPNLGLILGKSSGNLVDVDMDHPKALRLRDYFLPPTPMQTGRTARPRSHRWYIAEEGTLPATRQYKMPDGSSIIELRSTGGQTVIPPSIWYPKDWDGSKESTQLYRWDGTPWGGKKGPAKVDGKVLSIQVALTALGSVLLDQWPKAGGRHEAYLALAGGLLRLRDEVHPWWKKNLPVLISALAQATNDEDGPQQRITETMGTTVTRITEGGKATGFGKLAEILGEEHAEQARRLAKEVESLAGFRPTAPERVEYREDAPETQQLGAAREGEGRNPMAERLSTWAAVDIGPYLAGEVESPQPEVLTRTDGVSLFYPGRVNTLFGLSESAKTWIALYAGLQEMGKGERVMYIDFEDEPTTAISRLRAMGLGDDDFVTLFRYVHPEEPISEMQRYKFGESHTAKGKQSSAVFNTLLEEFDPTLIITDGMTMMYGLHGHDTNDATGTDVVVSWLKHLTRNGRTTVVAIDHTGKGGGAGSSPIGAHHKVAMVQGTALRADAIERPMQGRVGRIKITVYKDRHGVVRANSAPGTKEQNAGTVVMDSTVEGVTTMTLNPPDEKEFVLADNEESAALLAEMAEIEERSEKVLEMFKESEYLTTPEVRGALNLPRKDVVRVWEYLESLGQIVREGENRHTKYRLCRVDKKTGEVS